MISNVDQVPMHESEQVAPALLSSAERIARELTQGPLKRQASFSKSHKVQDASPNYAPPGGVAVVDLPARIPANCVATSARDYALNPMILLAVLKVESNGRTGLVSPNANGTYDLGPAQFNTNSWAKRLEKRYNISREALINDMCQSIRAMAYALRTEINGVNGDLWRGIGNYHSRTPKFHDKYVGLVSSAHKSMISRGKF
jgi:hypothetical protein